MNKKMLKIAAVMAASLVSAMSSNHLSAAESPAVPQEIGVNLSVSRYYSPQLIFVDVFKQSRAWLPQLADAGTWDTGDTLDLDENGWVRSLKPGQAAGTLMLREIRGHYPAGEYIALYDGQGTIRFDWDATVKSRSNGRAVLDVTPSHNGIYVKIVATDPSDPIRNIRIIMPGHEATYQEQPFNPTFLDGLKGFRVLRFMQWGTNNRSYYAGWAGRATPDYMSQGTERDVAIEYMVDLANATQSDAWFSVPYLADEEYMRNMAELVRDRLDPGLKAYVEFSNEIWNGIFPQSRYAMQQSDLLGLSENKYTGRFYWYSMRTSEMFKIWEEVFGGTERLVRVVGAQSANPWVAKTILNYGDTGAHTDAIAIAPYIGGLLGTAERAETTVGMSLDELFATLESDIDRIMDGHVVPHVELARQRNLELIAYEGGQHLAGVAGALDNSALTSLFISANRDPRMGEVYKAYLARWETLGGGSFVMFDNVSNYSKYGSWGLKEYQDQPLEDAHKLRALQDIMSGNDVLVCE